MGGKNRKGLAVGRVPEGFDDYAFYDLVATLTKPSEWPPIELRLDDGELTDFPPSQVLRRLVSPALREVFSKFENPHVLWLPVRLKQKRRRLEYFFPHFTPKLDVLNKKESKFFNGRLTIPCISTRKAKKIPYFCLNPLSATIIVQGDVLKAIKGSGCVGVEFEPIAFV